MELLPASDYWDLIADSLDSPILALVFRLPPRLHRQVAMVQNELQEIDKGQIYSSPSTLHITVKVFGVSGRSIDEDQQASILAQTEEILSDLSPFRVDFRGLSYFSTSIYINVEDPMDRLRMINKRLIEKLGNLVETSQYDGDSYIPHVTVATFNTRKADELISRITSKDMTQMEFGSVEVLEMEAVEARMFLLLGPSETQKSGLNYLRAFHLTGKQTQRQK